MNTKRIIPVLMVVCLLSACQTKLPVIVCSENPTKAEMLAAKELRRYLYLRTGQMTEIQASAATQSAPDFAIVLGRDAESLQGEEYKLETVGRRLFITAGSEQALLYGAYKFAEHLGVRFYLHGDVVPDERMTTFAMPVLNEMHKPLFATRGIQPFHDFPEGPDWWTANEYKAILAQLPKMGMNFIGFHNYPHPEPLIWVGRPEEVDDDGKVSTAYYARHFYTTANCPYWGYGVRLTDDYSFGAADFYDRSIYGPVYQQGYEKAQGEAVPDTAKRDYTGLFNNSARFFKDVFTYAHHRGVKVCVGTETPMMVTGKDIPTDTAGIRKMYEGTFTWIKRNYPIDYYWLWTREEWTWGGNTQKELDAVVADMRAALAAMKDVNATFGLATCGWVLGPVQDRSLFDKFLPKDVPFSCINRAVGYTPVDVGFVSIRDRSKWAIPWMEDDPAMVLPQLWAGRTRRDAADALAYGCDGLIGILWRTRTIAPNVASLAEAAWEQQPWNPDADKQMTLDEAVANEKKTERDLDASDFYADWANSEFGTSVGTQMAAIFLRLDGSTPDGKGGWRAKLPVPTTWANGPGGLKHGTRPWSERKAFYNFIDEIEALRPQVNGAGNLERFDYWLNQFRYLRATDELDATLGAFSSKMKEVKAAKPQEQKDLARKELLPLRLRAIEQLREVHRMLFAFISTYGELGNLTNWQQHIMNLSFDAPAAELEMLLGEALPKEAFPDKETLYPARIIAPELRTMLDAGDSFAMRLIITAKAPTSAVLRYRNLGEGEFKTVDLKHLDRAVYEAVIPTPVTDDFEYYIDVATVDSVMRFPATAPELNQTVVVN